MSAPKGNNNAEKWTAEQTQKFVNAVYDYILNDKDCCSIEEACCELGYYEKILPYLEHKFNADNQLIDFDPIKKAKGILKHRIIKKGLTNKYNPTMAIFVLKNNHDMDDKHVLDQNTNVVIDWSNDKDSPSKTY